MAEVGSLQIGGSVNTQAIENGLSRVEGGLKNIVAVGNSVNSDFTRIGQSANYLGKKLKIIGTIGVASIIGLAKGAPAVAGAMANMKVSFGKLTRELGSALSPAFNRASEEFSKFVGWVSENAPIINSFAIDVVDGLTNSVKFLYGIWSDFVAVKIPFLDIEIGEGLKWLISNFGAEMVAGVLGGAVAGPAGAIASVGTVSIAKSASEGSWGSGIGGTVGGIGGALLGGPAGALIGFTAGALIGRSIDLYLNRNDRKSTSLDLEYAT